MVPASTSWAPVQRIATTLEKTRKITTAVRMARARLASRAVTKASSAAATNRLVTVFSAVKACMVRTAWMFSLAKAEVSARRSWASRERRRTSRPKATSGSTRRGMAATA